MAKTLKDFLNERQLGPMVVKNPDEQKFIDKHVIAKVADRNGNDDELFKGSKVKFADRKKDRKGYNPGEDEAVYEELKGGQVKLDKNHNGKLDAHDFNLLRKKKKVNEASYKDGDTRMGSVGPITTDAERAERAKKYREKMMKKESADYLETDLKKRKKNNDKAVEDMKKMGSPMKNPHFGEEAEQIDELSTPTLQSYRKKARAQGNAIVDKMKMGGGDWSKDQKDTKTLRKRAAGAQASGKQLVKRGESLKTEEAEQIGEGKWNYPKHMTKTVTTSDMDTTNAARNREERKAFRKKQKAIAHAALMKGLRKEEAEQIDELSRDTLRRYRMKAKSIGDNEKGDIGYRSKGRDLAARKTHGGQWGIPKAKVMASEEVELEESAMFAKRVHNVAKHYGFTNVGTGKEKASISHSNGESISHSHNGSMWVHSGKTGGTIKSGSSKDDSLSRHLEGRGYKLKEEVDLEEKLSPKASMGTYIKDFQKSDAPQFKGKSPAKRRVMAIAAKLSAERGGKPLNKEERLLANLGDLAESHKRTLLDVFAKLNEDNQRKFMATCETPEGIEQMLNFAIQYRGE